jgi:hypothetical protein
VSRSKADAFGRAFAKALPAGVRKAQEAEWKHTKKLRANKAKGKRAKTRKARARRASR